jgi:Domain of unknown function (DUF4160)
MKAPFLTGGRRSGADRARIVISFQPMPTLAIIDGVRIAMYYADHEHAHFHAIAGEDEVVVGIADLRVIAGTGRRGPARSYVGAASAG